MKKCFFFFLLIHLSLVGFSKSKDTLFVSQLEFIRNYGQWSGDFSFRSLLHNGAIFFDQEGYVVSMIDPKSLEKIHFSKFERQYDSDLSVRLSSYKVSFLNANAHSKYVEHGNFSSHFYNFFVSKDPNKWVSDVHATSSIYRQSLYDGIDLQVYQNASNLKYEFYVAPHVDPMIIQMFYQGVKGLSVVANTLIIDNYYSRIVECQPLAYQISVQGDTSFIPCKYVVRNNIVSFSMGAYDVSRPLIIDPEVVFSSYSGSTSDNWGYTATYDAQGNLYGGGISFGPGYPITLGAIQTSFCDGSSSSFVDVSISKFDATGSFLHYSTYLGGSYADIPHSLFVNENDELYIFGTTGSPDFPVTANAFDTSFNYGSAIGLSTSMQFPLGSDIFIAKFSANGKQLLASTYVGGSSNDGLNTAQLLCKNYADDNRGEIIVDLNSDVYVVSSTYSIDFPVTQNTFCATLLGGQDACVFKMNQDLSQLIWSGYLGGTSDDAGYSLTLAKDGGVYVCGGTTSSNFPTRYGVLQSRYAGNVDGFVSHISVNGTQLLQSSFLGMQGYDQAYLIKTDKEFFPYIFGQTEASSNEWIYNVNYSTWGGGQFLTKLSQNLQSKLWSTAFGTGVGGPDISPTALAIDLCHNIYMSGWGSNSLNGFGGTAGMPITLDAFQHTTDGSDYYFICLSEDAQQLVYGSYFGGSMSHAREHVDGGTSRFDKKGRIYQAVCAGCGGENSFPTTPQAWSTTNGSTNCNLGVIKMDFNLPVLVADFHFPSSICAPDSVHFENYSRVVGSNTSYYWDFGDGTNSNAVNPVHYYTESGYYPITLIIQDNVSCNYSDTLTKYLFVLANSVDTLATQSVCMGDFVQIGMPPSHSVSYNWSPTDFLSSATLSNPTASPTQTTWYVLVASLGSCVDTIYQKVYVEELHVNLSQDTTICAGDTANLSVTIPVPYNSIEWSTTPSFLTTFGANQTTVAVSPSETKTYYVRVKGDICVFVGEVDVAVFHPTVEVPEKVLLCFEDQISLSATHNGGDNCSYLWTLGDGSSYTTPNPTIFPDTTMSYSVVITTAQGCVASAEGIIIKRLGTFPTPFNAWCENCEIVQAQSTTVFSTNYGDGYQYQWTPVEDMSTPQSYSSKVNPLENTMYTVVVTDTFGCTISGTVFIKVQELTCDEPFIFIPNVFSPNGDKNNDVLYVRSEILDELYFAVYNRWGEKVFETTRIDEGWNGTYKDKPCQNGVYDYYFKGKCVNGKTHEIKGNVMLIR